MIVFNKPCFVGNEQKYIQECINTNKISGDGNFTRKCHEWFEKKLECKKVFLTTSCTHALEMAAILLDIKEGDEIIMPSYTFVSTANAFVLRGAKIIFVDIRPDTMNINESKIEEAITDKTKVIVPVHYAGVACEMDTIMRIANKYSLYVVEDAAQGMMSRYKGKALGTIGHLGTFSFHETKNYTSAGEGGLLLINDEKFRDRAEVIREKGTNRNLFFRGMVDKYSWVDLGSSYLMNDISASYLYAQLLKAELINNRRLNIWKKFNEKLKCITENNYISFPHIPNECIHNAHMYYLKVNNLEERTKLLEYLNKNSVMSTFHYVPLHSSKAGMKFGRFSAIDKFTTSESEKLIRLPLYYNLLDEEIEKIIITILEYFNEK